MLKMVFTTATVVCFFLGLVSFALAQMDDGNRNLLIEKLDHVYQGLAPNDSSKVAVTLRLADLYSERARVFSMKELEGACEECKSGDLDRKKALRLYTEVMDRAPESVQAKVLIQVGHLYQMVGDEARAIQFYQKILGQNIAPELKGEAQLSLGEIYFKRRDFAKAQGFYREVGNNPAAPSRGLAAYRAAWCLFNTGETKAATTQLEKILKTSSLLNRNGVAGAQIDTQFQEEVSRDYATFIAAQNIDKDLTESLFKLSPASIKVQNLRGLALDAERIGKKTEALMVWNFVVGYMDKAEDRLVAKVSMAQLYFDANKKSDGIAAFESAMDIWKDLKTCKTAQCEELRRRSRQFVVSWNQLEKKTLSAELLKAYQQYLMNFSDDIDMHIYSAQVAKGLKNWPEAWKSFDQARALLKLDSKQPDKLESTLVEMLDIAEEAKDEKLISQAYDLYLEQSPKKTKFFEVQYQKAHRLYETAKYLPASQELRKLALDKSGPMPVRKQAADLSLDALVLLKEETTLIVWANEYATLSPEWAGDFFPIVQKAILTKSANALGTSSEAAYSELKNFNPSQAAPEDRIKFYKNKLILAEKLNRYLEAQAAADQLLLEPGVSAADREFAWTRKAYMSEMALDFAGALSATGMLQSSLKPDEKILKMAIFAELSGQKSVNYYSQYLQKSSDEENKKLVAAELVRKSKVPDKEIELYRGILAKSPQLMAQLYTEAFAKTSNGEILKRVSKDGALKSTEPGKLLLRQGFLRDFAGLKTKITTHKLDTKNDRKLASSIKARADLLNKLEALTKQAIAAADFTSQLVALDLLGKESERFYNELMSAPLPEGLTDEEQQQYMSLLSAQATPFQAKAVATKMKVEEFWKGTHWVSSLKATWEQVELRNLILVEVKALREIAPESAKIALAEFSVEESNKQQAEKPGIQEIQKARNLVNQSPFDKKALQSLLELEKKSENMAMSQYLQNRIEGLQKNSRQETL